MNQVALARESASVALTSSGRSRLERDFWRDNNFPYFLVTLAPYGTGQSGTGGGGFTNAFNLYTANEVPFSTGLLSLLAHETFHTWNPLKMGRIRSPEENTNDQSPRVELSRITLTVNAQAGNLPAWKEADGVRCL